jgi:hypothetical protein
LKARDVRSVRDYLFQNDLEKTAKSMWAGEKTNFCIIPDPADSGKIISIEKRRRKNA